MWKLVAVGLAFGCLALTDISLHHVIFSKTYSYNLSGSRYIKDDVSYQKSEVIRLVTSCLAFSRLALKVISPFQASFIYSIQL